MFKLPVYFISDNHFMMDLNDAEKDRREKLFYVFDKIKSISSFDLIMRNRHKISAAPTKVASDIDSRSFKNSRTGNQRR